MAALGWLMNLDFAGSGITGVDTTPGVEWTFPNDRAQWSFNDDRAQWRFEGDRVQWDFRVEG